MALSATAALLLFFTSALPAQPPKVLRYAFRIAETGFDPAQALDLYSRTVTAHIFDGLYRYDHLARPFKIVPSTADGMPDVSDDFRTWTVRIRAGIYFSDDPIFKSVKRELVAQDYVYALKRFFDPRWKSAAYPTLAEVRLVGIDALRDEALKSRKPFDYDREVEGLRAIDRYTIRFKLADPQPRLLQTLASGDLFGAVAREVVEAYGDEITGKPVGTGPFRLAEWRRSSSIVLERSPTYRERAYDAQPNDDDAEGRLLVEHFKGRRLPMVDRVEISIIEEEQPRWLSFLNRQQDLLERLPNEFVNIAVPNGKLAPGLERAGIKPHRVLGADLTQWIYNMEHPTIGGYSAEKVALRRALNLASNTEQEIRLIRKQQAIVAQSALMPHTFGYDAAFRSENGEYSLPKARALLDLYGYADRDGDGWRELPDGSPLTLEVATQPDQLSRQLDELMSKDMAALGVRTAFKPAKWPENLKSARAGKLMVWRVGYSAAAPDGQPSFDGGYTGHKGGQNLSRFDRKEFDRLYTAMRVLPDGPERLALFEEAKRILLVYAPYKNGVHRIHTDLAHPWLHGYRRPPYWVDWWQYVDVDAESQMKATQ